MTPSVLEIGTDIMTMSLFWTIFLLLLEYLTPNSSLTAFPTAVSLPVIVTSKLSSFKYQANVFPKPLVPPIIATFIVFLLYSYLNVFIVLLW